jgi:NADPH:quinone reductase-like Zn-dependent oxidoreductase
LPVFVCPVIGFCVLLLTNHRNFSNFGFKPQFMKAYVLTRYSTAENSFEFRDLPDPVPNDNEVLIESEAFGLNYADVSARKGTYRDAPPIPCVIGYEGMGKVLRVGKNVKHLSVGDRVTSLVRFGGYATKFCALGLATVKIPEDMDAGIALALTVQYGTAWYMAEEATRLHEGDAVLIQAAAGGVGVALVQMARNRGCVIYGTAGSDEKLEFLRGLGVQHPINYRKTDFISEIKRLRGKEGLDVIFDSLGAGPFRKGKKLLRAGGRIMGFGSADRSNAGRNVFSSIRTLFGFGFPSAAFMLLNSRSIIGVNMLRISDENPVIIQRCLDGVIDAFSKGMLKPHVHKTFPHTQLADAHKELEGRASMGKIVVKW